MFDKELGIIGVGNIGSALLNRIVNSKIIEKQKIIIYDIDEDLLNRRSDEFNVEFAQNNIELASKSKYILIAVKPQVINSVLEEIGSLINNQQIIISIAAGIPLKYLSKFIKNNVGLIRIMTNTPALIGCGASAISHNGKINEEALNYVKNIFNAVGIVVELDEIHIDAVTGLSGSGPAYVFLVIEALADGGVKMGLPRSVSLKLAAQTVFGAAKLVIETGKHPALLKDMVTTPGGTTIDALHMLEIGNMRSILIDAVETATNKSRLLGSKD